MTMFSNNIIKLDPKLQPLVVIMADGLWKEQDHYTGKPPSTIPQVVAALRKIEDEERLRMFFLNFVERIILVDRKFLQWLDERFACPIVNKKMKASKFKPIPNVTFRSPHPLMLMASDPKCVSYRWGWVKGNVHEGTAWFDMEKVTIRFLCDAIRQSRKQIPTPTFTCVKVLAGVGKSRLCIMCMSPNTHVVPFAGYADTAKAIMNFLTPSPPLMKGRSGRHKLGKEAEVSEADDVVEDQDYHPGDETEDQGEREEQEAEIEAEKEEVAEEEDDAGTKSDIEKDKDTGSEADAFVTPSKDKPKPKAQKSSSSKSSGKPKAAAKRKKAGSGVEEVPAKKKKKTSKKKEESEAEEPQPQKAKRSRKKKVVSEDVVSEMDPIEKKVLMKAGAVLGETSDLANWEEVEKLASISQSEKLKEQYAMLKAAKTRAQVKQKAFLETSKRRIGELYRWDLTKPLPPIVHKDAILADALKIRDLDPSHMTRHMERYLSDPSKETDGEGPFIIATFGLLRTANILSLTDVQKRKLKIGELMDKYVFTGKVPAVQLAGLHRIATLKDIREDASTPKEMSEEFFRFHKAMVYDFPELSLEYVKQCRLIGFQDNKIVMRQLSFTEKLEASRRIAMMMTDGDLEKMTPEIRQAIKNQINEEMGDEMKDQVYFFHFVSLWQKSSYDLLLAISKDEVMYRDGWPDPTQKAVIQKRLAAKGKGSPKTGDKPKRGRGRPKLSKSMKVNQVFEPWRHCEMPSFVPLWSMPPHIRDELMCRIINRSIEMKNLKKECERQKSIINATAHLVMEYNLFFGKESATAKVKNFTELSRKFPLAVKLFLSAPSTHEFMRKMYLECSNLHACVPLELQEQLMYQGGNLAETLETKLIEFRQSLHQEVREKSQAFQLFWLSFRSFLTGAESGKSDTLSFAFDQNQVTVYTVKNNYTGIVTKHYVIQGDVLELSTLLSDPKVLGPNLAEWPKLGKARLCVECAMFADEWIARVNFCIYKSMQIFQKKFQHDLSLSCCSEFLHL